MTSTATSACQDDCRNCTTTACFEVDKGTEFVIYARPEPDFDDPPLYEFTSHAHRIYAAQKVRDKIKLRRDPKRFISKGPGERCRPKPRSRLWPYRVKIKFSY